jgi:hypothetical protein
MNNHLKNEGHQNQARLDVDERHEQLAEALMAQLRYPAVERLFDDYPQSLVAARARLTQTRQAFERILRQGSPQEAARASRAIAAYDQALGFLDELESRFTARPPENSPRR